MISFEEIYLLTNHIKSCAELIADLVSYQKDADQASKAAKELKQMADRLLEGLSTTKSLTEKQHEINMKINRENELEQYRREEYRKQNEGFGL